MNSSLMERYISYFTFCHEEFSHFAVILINTSDNCEESPLLEALQCSDGVKNTALFLKLARTLSFNVKEIEIVQIVEETIGWLLYLKRYTLNLKT